MSAMVLLFLLLLAEGQCGADFRVQEAPATGHRRLSKVVASDWAELKALCEAGGNEVALSDSFDASAYAGGG
jgi:hypothetical protein